MLNMKQRNYVLLRIVYNLACHHFNLNILPFVLQCVHHSLTFVPQVYFCNQILKIKGPHKLYQFMSLYHDQAFRNQDFDAFKECFTVGRLLTARGLYTFSSHMYRTGMVYHICYFKVIAWRFRTDLLLLKRELL